jgi:hypothetical protein
MHRRTTQTLSSLVGVGLGLIAIGIAIITTDKISTFPLMSERRRQFIGWSTFILGFVIATVFILIGAFRLFYKATFEFQVSVSPRVLERFEYEFDDELCKADEISEVLSLDDGVLDRLSHVDRDFLIERHQLNNGIIRCVRKTKTGSKQLSGFYIMYPITAECERLIEQGYLVGSRMILKEHVCRSFDDAAAIYISAVYGRDMSTRGFVIYLLKRDLSDLLRRNAKVKNIYSRPASSEGHLLVRKFKFRPVEHNPEMYCRSVEPV